MVGSPRSCLKGGHTHIMLLKPHNGVCHPPPSSALLFEGLYPHPPGPNSGLTPKGCSPAWDWLSPFETSPGSSKGSWCRGMNQCPCSHTPEMWHCNLRGDALTPPSPSKRALHPPPPPWVSRLLQVGSSWAECTKCPQFGTKCCPGVPWISSSPTPPWGSPWPSVTALRPRGS